MSKSKKLFTKHLQKDENNGKINENKLNGGNMKFRNILVLCTILMFTLLVSCGVENVEVKKPNYEDYTFTSNTFAYDGEAHSLELTGKALPQYYEVVYENNDQTEPGKYYVTASIYSELFNETIHEYNAVLVIDGKQNEEFEAWMDEMLVSIFEDDQISINFFFNDPSTYGIGHYDATLPTYSESESTWEEEMAPIQEILDELKAFDYEALNAEEKISYQIVERYFDYILSITENMNYMTNSYLGSYLGYQANLPLELAEYKFRNEQDIKDFISYLDNAPAAFKSYFEFTKKQAEYGYAMPDYVIENVLGQCEEFIALGENHFLINVFNDKIDNVDFEVVDKTVDEYKAAAKTAVTGPLTEAYAYINDNLASLQGLATVNGGLKQFGEEGQQYYDIMMEHTIGIKGVTGADYIKYVDQKISEIDYELMEIVNEFNNNMSQSDVVDFYYGAVNNNPLFSDLDVEEILPAFRELAKSIVPEIEEMPEISIKYVPDALKDNYSPAAYYVSAMDETKHESIYLNPNYISDYNYIFTTLAHEGYPGHLYQNVYTKSLNINDVRRVLRCSGYTEGWATYVEMKSYNFASNYTSYGQKRALEYLRLNSIYNGLLSVRFDLGIHYEGWTVDQMVSWTNELLGSLYTVEELLPQYNQIVEIPTNMSEYFIPYLIFEDLHTLAQVVLGDDFNEIAFNKVLLDQGSVPLDIMIQEVYDYLEETTFVLDYEKVFSVDDYFDEDPIFSK